jgi:acyl-CoA dehydrogenase
MDWSFTEEQEELAALARRIVTDKLTEERMREVESSASRIDFELLAELARSGVVGVGLPTDLGGGGYGLIEQCRVLVELGRTVAPVPVLASIVMGAMPIAEFGHGDQRQWARAAAGGEVILTAALVEEFNADSSQPTTTAERSGDGWVVNGTKTNVPAGPAAEVFLVPASTDEGVTVFLVEPSDDGMTVSPQEVTNKQFEAQLQLDGVVLGDERVLGEVGQGAEIVRWIWRRAVVGALCSSACASAPLN